MPQKPAGVADFLREAKCSSAGPMWRALAISLLLVMALASCTSSRRSVVPKTEPIPATAQQIRLFNPKVLGKSAGEPVLLLQPQDGSKVDPIFVQTDVKNGIYVAATIAYPDSVTFEQAQASVNALYGSHLYKNFTNIWRMDKDRFTVAIQKDEKGISLLYLAFQPSEEILRDMIKAGVFGDEVRDQLANPQKSPAESQQ